MIKGNIWEGNLVLGGYIIYKGNVIFPGPYLHTIGCLVIGGHIVLFLGYGPIFLIP
jgi:hypothetical protein